MSSQITSILANSSAVNDAARAELGDARRTKRLKMIVAALGMRSDASLPEALETEAEREGYYRFIASEHVQFQPLFSFHADATARRAEAVQAKEILVLHDTSEFAWKIWDEEPSRAFLARPSSGTQDFSIHLSMAVARLDDTIGHQGPTSFAPLGYVNARPFVHQKELEKAGGGADARAFWQAVNGLFEKGGEGERWHEAVEQSCQRLQGAMESGARVVHVGDREADAYWLLSRLIAQKDGFVIRMTAPEKRRVKTGERRTDFETLAEAMEGVGWSTVQKARVGWRPAKNATNRDGFRPRKGRTAKVRVRAKRVKVRRPDGLEAWAYPEHLSVWVVEAKERNPLRRGGAHPLGAGHQRTRGGGAPEHGASLARRRHLPRPLVDRGRV